MRGAGSGTGVVVLGSANVDVVLSVARVPAAGETVLASAVARHAGGKGLNQGVAAARSGARTTFLGAVGRDGDGDLLADLLAGEGVGTSLLRRVDAPTGTAHVAVQADGDNAIVVAPGANGAMTDLTAAERDAVAAARVLVAQLEVPIGGVAAAVEAARAAGTTVVLNAAPAARLPDEVLAAVDVLVVNEREAATAAGVTVGGDGPEPGELVAALLERVPGVLLTLGGRGALVGEHGGGTTAVPAPAVQVLDTTGAGDTATGALAAALAAGAPLEAAARRAVVAGSLSVQVAGAVPSIPRAEQVDAVVAAADDAAVDGWLGRPARGGPPSPGP